LWDATQLEYLDMSLNSFSGSIPIFKMSKNLAQLKLYDNHLFGQIASTQSQWEEDHFPCKESYLQSMR
jgi:hypothetical protein